MKQRLKNVKGETWLLLGLCLAMLTLLFCYNHYLPGCLAFWKSGVNAGSMAASCTDPQCLVRAALAMCFNGLVLWFLFVKLINPVLDRKYKTKKA